MSRRPVVTFLLTVIFALAGPCYGQDRAALGFILDVLRRSHLSGSLVACGFPMTTKPIDSTAPPLQVFHEMFANDGEMQVTQEPDGTIRMMEKTVPQDLLKVKIAHISFDDEQKRNPNSMYFHKLVMDFITGAPEVKAFMKDQSILFAPKVINQAMSPHLNFSGELKNVTLSEALDYMSKAFRGLWVYDECPGSNGNMRIVDFSFYSTE